MPIIPKSLTRKRSRSEISTAFWFPKKMHQYFETYRKSLGENAMTQREFFLLAGLEKVERETGVSYQGVSDE